MITGLPVNRQLYKQDFVQVPSQTGVQLRRKMGRKTSILGEILPNLSALNKDVEKDFLLLKMMKQQLKKLGTLIESDDLS